MEARSVTLLALFGRMLDGDDRWATPQRAALLASATRVL